MQCYEYLAIQKYARRNFGWAGHFDDLELAETLDEKDVESLRDVDRMNPADRERSGRHARKQG